MLIVSADGDLPSPRSEDVVVELHVVELSSDDAPSSKVHVAGSRCTLRITRETVDNSLG